MNRFSPGRRRLLRASAALGAMHLAPGMQVVRDARAAAAGRTLVSIHLSGGNDSLNTVIPYTDPGYAAIRKALAVPRADVLPIDASHALHPSLVSLKALWDQRRVAILHGVGYPNFNFSHFQAREIYWEADLTRARTTGWLGRSLDQTLPPAPSPLSAIAINGGSAQSLAALQARTLQISTDASALAFHVRNGSQVGVGLQSMLTQAPTGTNVLLDGVIAAMTTARAAEQAVRAAGALTPGAVYPAGNRVAPLLRHAVQLMRQDSDVRVITLSQGNYDTHEDGPIRHAQELLELDRALGAFFADIDANGLSDRVLVLLWSEFSRNVYPNGSNGFDHGAAQSMILVGNGVTPGVQGVLPQIAPASLLSGRYLPMRVDFREVYAELLENWLATPSATVLGGTYARTALLL
ncbi:MAG: DUF1501 domain-containing protein [Burkholderiales bacterium]|jgi:uncharacterized protein (DUF1501 family)|nr:DUF1501 domain-containing protein [Burkholderiales bacterium]